MEQSRANLITEKLTLHSTYWSEKEDVQGLTVLIFFLPIFITTIAHHILSSSFGGIQRRRRTENTIARRKRLNSELGIAVAVPQNSFSMQISSWNLGAPLENSSAHSKECNAMQWSEQIDRPIYIMSHHRSRGSVWSLMTWRSDTSASDLRLHLSRASTK